MSASVSACFPPSAFPAAPAQEPVAASANASITFVVTLYGKQVDRKSIDLQEVSAFQGLTAHIKAFIKENMSITIFTPIHQPPEKIWKQLEEWAKGLNLEVSRGGFLGGEIVVKRPPLKTQTTSEERILTYDDRTDSFLLTSTTADTLTGKRRYQDGRAEEGTFDSFTARFTSGKITTAEGETYWANPTFLAVNIYSSEGILEEEGSLIALKRAPKNLYLFEKHDLTTPIETFIAQSYTQCGNTPKTDIDFYFKRRDFSKERFAEAIVHNEIKDRHPRIFDIYKPETFLAICKTIDLDPERIRSSSYENLFFYSLHEKNYEALIALAQKYPEKFSKFSERIIAEVIAKRCSAATVAALAEADPLQEKNLELWQQIRIIGKEKEITWDALQHLEPAKRKELVDLAFDYNNPYLLEPSQPIPPEQYSINLMWINKSKEDKKRLYGENDAEFQAKIIDPLLAWSRLHPKTPIYMWYDSEVASPKAIALLKKTVGEKIRCRDIREIPVVQQNPAPFTPDIPVYFRVDLLRAICMDYLLETEKRHYCIYSDLDFAPFLPNTLFDKRTVDQLDDLGFVMSKDDQIPYENGFLIFNSEHSKCREGLKKFLINFNVAMVNEGKKCHEQQVYGSFAGLLHWLFVESKKGILPSSEERPDVWESAMCMSKNFHLLVDGERRSAKDLMPRKAVSAPPSCFIGKPVQYFTPHPLLEERVPA